MKFIKKFFEGNPYQDQYVAEADKLDTPITYAPRQNITTDTNEKTESPKQPKILNVEQETDDETLVNLRVTNPLHKITQLLENIRKHQATTFSLRFTIPLIALPVFLLTAFQLGRLQTSCSPVFSSKIGVIRNINILAPKKQQGFISYIFSFLPNIPSLEKPSELYPTNQAILIQNSNEIINILHRSDISLRLYENQNVIITGQFVGCTNNMTLDTSNNISFL